MKVEERLLDKIRGRLKENNPINWYWDYNDSISIKSIKSAIEKTKKGKDGLTAYQVLQDQVWEDNIDNLYNMEIEAIENAIKDLDKKIAEVEGIDINVLSIKKYAIKIREKVMDSIEIHMSIDELLTGSLNITIPMYSNYSCFNSWFFETEGGLEYEDSYFGDMVNVLQLNPLKLKELLEDKGYKTLGSWPKKKDTNRWIDYDKFIEEMENHTCPASLFTIVGKINTKELLKNYGKKGLKITIPKGNTVGMHSPWQGGGSIFECPLIRDISLTIGEPINGGTEYDHFSLLLDGEDEYSIKSTYGVVDEFFGKEITIHSTRA